MQRARRLAGRFMTRHHAKRLNNRCYRGRGYYRYDLYRCAGIVPLPPPLQRVAVSADRRVPVAGGPRRYLQLDSKRSMTNDRR